MAQATQLIETAQSTLVGSPTEEAKRAAHTLKSIALAFGAENLADLCRRLEDAIKQGHRGQIEELLASVENERAKVQVSLKQMLIELGTGDSTTA